MVGIIGWKLQTLQTRCSSARTPPIPKIKKLTGATIRNLTKGFLHAILIPSLIINLSFVELMHVASGRVRRKTVSLFRIDLHFISIGNTIII